MRDAILVVVAIPDVTLDVDAIQDASILAFGDATNVVATIELVEASSTACVLPAQSKLISIAVRLVDVTKGATAVVKPVGQDSYRFQFV